MVKVSRKLFVSLSRQLQAPRNLVNASPTDTKSSLKTQSAKALFFNTRIRVKVRR